MRHSFFSIPAATISTIEKVDHDYRVTIATAIMPRLFASIITSKGYSEKWYFPSLSKDTILEMSEQLRYSIAGLMISHESFSVEPIVGGISISVQPATEATIQYILEVRNGGSILLKAPTSKEFQQHRRTRSSLLRALLLKH